MGKKVAIVDYNVCNPSECKDGICISALECPTKTLTQEASYEKPFPMGICRGCGKCVVACPLKAIKIIS